MWRKIVTIGFVVEPPGVQIACSTVTFAKTWVVRLFAVSARRRSKLSASIETSTPSVRLGEYSKRPDRRGGTGWPPAPSARGFAGIRQREKTQDQQQRAGAGDGGVRVGERAAGPGRRRWRRGELIPAPGAPDGHRDQGDEVGPRRRPSAHEVVWPGEENAFGQELDRHVGGGEIGWQRLTGRRRERQDDQPDQPHQREGHAEVRDEESQDDPSSPNCTPHEHPPSVFRRGP